MAAPGNKLFDLTNDIYLSPKSLGDRLIIDIRQYKTYEGANGKRSKPYPGKEAVFLYLSQYAKLRSLLDSTPSMFYAFDTQPMEATMEPSVDIGFGASVQPTMLGSVIITVPSRKGPKSISLGSAQQAAMQIHNDGIESEIKAIKQWLEEKRTAEDAAATTIANEEAQKRSIDDVVAMVAANGKENMLEASKKQKKNLTEIVE